MSTTVTKNGIPPLDTRNRPPPNDEVIALRQQLRVIQRKNEELIETVREQDELIAHLQARVPEPVLAPIDEDVPVSALARAADQRAAAAAACAAAAEKRAAAPSTALVAVPNSGTAYPMVPYQSVAGRKPKRTQGLPKVDKAVALTTQHESKDFDTVPFLAHFGIKDPQQLQYKLAEYLIALHGVTDPEQQRKHRNQAKFKADNFLKLLWFDAPQSAYAVGDAEGLFDFFLTQTHADMGRDRPYFNHDHRIAHWFWPQVADYAAFRHVDNAYIARQGRAFMTGVRAVHHLFRVANGEAWPTGPTAPLLAITDKSAKRAARPPTTKPKRQRKAKDDASEAEASATSGDESDEGYWSAHSSSAATDEDGDVGSDDELKSEWLAFYEARGR